MRILLIIALEITLGLSLLAQGVSDVRILEEDASSITIEYLPQVGTGSVKGEDGRFYTRFEFLHRVNDAAQAGALLTSYRSLLLHLPSKNSTLTILSAEYQDTTGINPAAFPRFESSQGLGLTAIYPPLSLQTTSMGFQPSLAVTLNDVGEARGFLLGTLKLYPVQISAGQSKARIYSRLILKITFSTPHQSGQRISDFIQGAFPISNPRGILTKTTGITGDSPLATGDWYKFDVTATGIYKIDQAFFTKANISLGSLGNINTIRIFGNGGKELPENQETSRPNGLQEIARLVIDNNGNGQLDADDAILFYAKAVRDWQYNQDGNRFQHYINHYTETNTYFLTFGGTTQGKTMGTIASSARSDAYVPPDCLGKTFHEKEALNFLDSGREWAGEQFDSTTAVQVFTTSLPGIDTTKPLLYRAVFYGQSESDGMFYLEESGKSIGAPVLLPSTPNFTSVYQPRAYQTPVQEWWTRASISGERSSLRIRYAVAAQLGPSKGFLDWFEIHYRQRFEAVSDLLVFHAPDTSAVVEYRLSKFSSRNVYAFDISDHNYVRLITNLLFDPADQSKVTFQVSQTSGALKEFAVVGPQGFKTPANLRKITNSNLSGVADKIDFIIISPSEFLIEAERLKSHRMNRDQLNTIVVNIDHIFNEFSSGVPDPTAIRDFLFMAYKSWKIPPKYVLLLGGANFDYRNIRSTVRNWIIPYESSSSLHPLGTYTSDDYFVLLEPNNERISMAIGRMPVRSVTEAKDVIDKIIQYEIASPFHTWRNRITFVADDAITPSYDNEYMHTTQTDELAERFTPAGIQKDKIYLVEYPTVLSASRRLKPTVNQAIVDAVNKGTLILNYIGHGSPVVWADEYVFVQADDFPKLQNDGLYFLCVAATCDYARYDDDRKVSAGEQLLTLQNRGAIAVITAARVVYSNENAAFNNTLYENIFKRDAVGQQLRLGDALWATKQTRYGPNDHKYHLFGDPTMRLATPRLTASIDSINGKQPTDTITVPILGKTKLAGSVRKADGSRWASFQGRALLEVFDSKRTVMIPEWGNFSYSVNGGLIYRGEISVRNGSYNAIFPVPKDISYDKNTARVSLYAWSDSLDASGFTENLIFGGSATSGEQDTTGPTITIKLDDANFQSGDFVKSASTIIVDLYDQNGINTSIAGIGHRLEASLDRSRTIDLTNYYRANLDTYQSGRIEYPLKEVAEGKHTLEVKAWDIHNNSSMAETYFEVKSEERFGIDDVYNYPNPFNHSTQFTFRRGSSEPISVEIKIYTVAGRLIETLRRESVSDRFVRIPWEGRDRDGNEIANGVYLYKVITTSLDGSSTNEVLGKLTVMR
ncbi:MAG: type IX secretion system sortase PorU [bacterium]